MKHDYNLPPDAPQFVKAKKVAENISDVRVWDKELGLDTVFKTYKLIEQTTTLNFLICYGQSYKYSSTIL